MRNNKLFFYMLIVFSFSFSQKNFDLLTTGGSKILGNICQNPAWGLDSHTFTIEMFNDSYSNQVTSLFVGMINDEHKISWYEGLMNLSSSNKRKRVRASKYYQRGLGWLNEDSSSQLYLALSKNYDIKKVYLDKYPDFYISVEDDEEPLLENPPNFFRGEPAYFTTSNNRFYFVSRSSDKEIFYTNTIDEGLDDLYESGFKNLNLEIPIKSISVTPDNSELLVVTYNEALSEIYNFDLKFGVGKKILYNQKLVKKPDERLLYFDCMRDPSNNSRYILIGGNKELDDNSTAYAFIMNDDEVEGKFLIYRHKEESANYIEPVVQFYPNSNLIYFLNPKEGNEKILSYWDGEKVVETSMDLKNIRDFKISPDGEKFLVVTFKPEDLYVYSLKK